MILYFVCLIYYEREDVGLKEGRILTQKTGSNIFNRSLRLATTKLFQAAFLSGVCHRFGQAKVGVKSSHYSLFRL